MNNVLVKIKEMREKNGLTLNDLACVTGYQSAKGYRDLEMGKIKLTVEHLQRLADFYNLPICFFFDESITKKVHRGKTGNDVA